MHANHREERDEIAAGDIAAAVGLKFTTTGDTLAADNAPIVLEDGVWLCARTTVLRGVTIGANSTVAATALVTRDVPPNSIVVPPPSNIVRG